MRFPALIESSEVRHIRHRPFNSVSAAEDIGNALRVQLALAAVIAGIGAFGMETAVSHLGGDRRKGFVVGVVRVDCQFQIGRIIKGGRGKLLVNDHRHNGIIQNGGQRRLHFLTVILQDDSGNIPPLRLLDVIGIRQRIAAPHRRAGKNFHAVVLLAVHNGTVQRFPAVTGSEHGGLRVAEHHQRDIAGTVRGVVPLHLQIAGVCFGITDDLRNTGILHRRGIFPLGLLGFFPLRIVFGLPAYDLLQICHTKNSSCYLDFCCVGWERCFA